MRGVDGKPGHEAGPALRVISGGEDRPSVLVAGFEGALGAGLRLVIARDSELRVVGGPGGSEVEALIAEHRPDAALIWHDALSGVSAIRRLALGYRASAIVVAVMHPDPHRDERLLAAGARAVFPLTSEARELCTILRFAAQGLVGTLRPAREPAADGLASLTARETEVLELLAAGHSAREAAELLHVSKATVNTHRRGLYAKLGVHDRAELRARAARLLGPERPDPAPGATPPREPHPFRRRSRGSLYWARPQAPDMRSALDVARWHRT